jgi:GT2 family glycosyltransferase
MLYDVFKLKKIGGLSRQLLMYFSENDIGIRAARFGYTFLYDSSQIVIHEFGVAGKRR